MFAVERTANIKVNQLQTRIIIFRTVVLIKAVALSLKKREFSTFCPLSRKLKAKRLCDLCDSIPAVGGTGGELLFKQI